MVHFSYYIFIFLYFIYAIIPNIVIIPISKVSFGFAAGGSEFNEETIDEYNRKEMEEL